MHKVDADHGQNWLGFVVWSWQITRLLHNCPEKNCTKHTYMFPTWPMVTVGTIWFWPNIITLSFLKIPIVTRMAHLLLLGYPAHKDRKCMLHDQSFGQRKLVIRNQVWQNIPGNCDFEDYSEELSVKWGVSYHVHVEYDTGHTTDLKWTTQHTLRRLTQPLDDDYLEV